MSSAAISLPRPLGRALVVGSDGCRPTPLRVLQGVGYDCEQTDDPYAAMLELCRRPLVYRAVVLSLQGLYREELALITAVRRRFPHVSIWLAHTDGRQATLAEAMRLGVEGLLDEDGLHRFGDTAPTPGITATTRSLQYYPVYVDEAEMRPVEAPAVHPADASSDEPVLTAEELRALLGDDLPPAMPGAAEIR